MLRKALLFGALATVTLAQCQAGGLYDQQLGGCVYLQASATFSQAESACVQRGGHLVSVHNAFDNTDVTQQGAAGAFQRFFLGAMRYGANLTFYNVDGSAWTYQNWAPIQPLSDNCVAIQTDSRQWYTTDCNQPLPSICLARNTVPTVSPTLQCPAGWSYFAASNACYWVGTNSTFYDSEATCQRLGGHLASVHSLAESSYIIGLTLSYANSCSRSAPYWSVGWIGGLMNNVWTWTDGTPFNFDKLYGHGDPKTGALSITSEISCSDLGYWRVRDPSKVLPWYVCKRYPGY
ncbi:unnamed protein product, partial [Mesorhabditis spiculigera]